MFKVILYYKYIEIPNPAEFVNAQRELCQRLNLTGRILIAREGINGTLEGKEEDIKKYCEDFHSNPLFADVKIKISDSDGKAFRKLVVKERSEIVASHLPQDFSPHRLTGKYLEAEQLHEWFNSGKEFYIVDMRNDYETASGFFENSIPSQIQNFRYLPEVLPKIEHLKGKTIVTVCTGGVRCEKASGFLLYNGFKDVYQLKDGIVTYMEKYPNQHFKGKLYVFDKRYLMGFNVTDPAHEIVGKCFKCQEPSEQYVNCAYDECHKHFICCNDCLVDGVSFCSDKCKKIVAAKELRNNLIAATKITDAKKFLLKQFNKRVFKPARHYFIAFKVHLNRAIN